MSQKKYVIKDLYGMPKVTKFVSDSTTGLEDIWHTNWPNEKELNEEYRPKVFEDLTEAKRYLKEIKRLASRDWSESRHIYQRYGYNKPEWDIYEFQELKG